MRRVTLDKRKYGGRSDKSSVSTQSRKSDREGLAEFGIHFQQRRMQCNAIIQSIYGINDTFSSSVFKLIPVFFWYLDKSLR